MKSVFQIIVSIETKNRIFVTNETVRFSSGAKIGHRMIDESVGTKVTE
jgi:hypothetical protein